MTTKVINYSIRSIAFLALLLSCNLIKAQSWVDTLDTYARESFLPANHYHWRWTDAALLNTMMKQYETCPVQYKSYYMDYVKTAMDGTYKWANGKTPNSVASAMGLAFLYRITDQKKYKLKAEKVYADYLKIRRTKEGAVSHLMLFTELWDDTIFMIGQYLLNMYETTGNEKYLDEFMKQLRLHREKLQVAEYGLWVHGWDSNNHTHCTFCSQMFWADKTTRRSTEMWGRGNGWIIVTIADALTMLPKGNKYHSELEGYLKEMIARLPELQDEKTGHWFQLPARKSEEGNWIESSSTAMFAYGIQTALTLGLVQDTVYQKAVDKAYKGLREYSIIPKDNYLTVSNVCTGTCIGHKQYYFKRKRTVGKPYAIGMLIQFGRKYEAAQKKK
ncbi:MAG: glycoside hydrolase family 88 protein [Chitinophagales bacterium]